ncbi:hypothetical protein Rsub_02083 [Raphidocelis subcapitata]|uniref:Plastid lipid-associated protein/fibrillin conserved domain-containing protein n=1 Tax=Raphidocelis subcapitata TaxID=307507 RepID=A0A2V0NPG4_9CHLO|nr:hypothetical protein Rsub_02083 [Raphidocelis subcapitata]|eukprot:GBF89511.1 hypothetical protein Rsub_02083 [Raphidocelis subcapitata]
MQAAASSQCARARPALQRQLPARPHPPRCRRSVAARAAAAAGKPSEPAALAAFKAAHPANLEECLSLLKTAATTKAVDPEIVEGALVWLEQNTAAGPAGGGVQSVDGSWRLVFSTSTGLRFFQYIPVKEDLVIDTASKAISLESELGPFRFVIGGAISGWRPESGELDFQFSAVDILLFGNKIWTVNPATKPKTYSFYFVGGRISAARSSAGGLSLLLK